MNAPLTSPPANKLQVRGKIFLCVITYRYEVDFRVTRSVEAACFGLAARGWLPVPSYQKANSDLEHGRNALAAEAFMNPAQFRKVVFIDADVSCDEGTIERLVEHPVDLVLGSYRIKSDEHGERFALRKLPGPVQFVNPINGEHHPNGIAKIAGGPAGMMCVSRACLEKMIKHHDNQWYGAPTVTGGKAWPLFEFDVIEHERISEDMNFVRKWREMGGDAWVDPHLRLHHHDGGKTYSGCLADHLHDLDVVIDPQRTAKIAAAPIDVSMADLLAREG